MEYSYKFRLYPTREQENLMQRICVQPFSRRKDKGIQRSRKKPYKVSANAGTSGDEERI